MILVIDLPGRTYYTWGMSTDPVSMTFLKNLLSTITARINALRDRKKRLLDTYKKEIAVKEAEQIRNDILEQ